MHATCAPSVRPSAFVHLFPPYLNEVTCDLRFLHVYGLRTMPTTRLGLKVKVKGYSTVVEAATLIEGSSTFNTN